MNINKIKNDDTVPVDWTDGIHLNQDNSNGVTENLRYV